MVKYVLLNLFRNDSFHDLLLPYRAKISPEPELHLKLGESKPSWSLAGTLLKPLTSLSVKRSHPEFYIGIITLNLTYYQTKNDEESAQLGQCQL